MITRRRTRPADVAVALAQTAAALAAHTAAAGCLPSGRTLALGLPAVLAAALVLGRLLPRRPLLALAAGQLAGHGVLALAGCATGSAHAGHAVHSPLMLLGHVLALVACRAVLDTVVALADRAATTARRLLARWVRSPEPLAVVRVQQAPAPAPRRARRAVAPHRLTPRRGPPCARRRLPA